MTINRGAGYILPGQRGSGPVETLRRNVSTIPHQIESGHNLPGGENLSIATINRELGIEGIDFVIPYLIRNPEKEEIDSRDARKGENWIITIFPPDR